MKQESYYRFFPDISCWRHVSDRSPWPTIRPNYMKKILQFSLAITTSYYHFFNNSLCLKNILHVHHDGKSRILQKATLWNKSEIFYIMKKWRAFYTKQVTFQQAGDRSQGGVKGTGRWRQVNVILSIYTLISLFSRTIHAMQRMSVPLFISVCMRVVIPELILSVF